MADDAVTEELEAAEPDDVAEPADGGAWQYSSTGLLRRHVGRRVRITVEHPGRDRGKTFEGTLLVTEPSPVSGVYQRISLSGEDWSEQELNLPLGHPVEVYVVPIQEFSELPDGTDVAALVAEAARRYEIDQSFHDRARAALLAAMTATEYTDVEGAVLVGACLALVIADHPEVTRGS